MEALGSVDGVASGEIRMRRAPGRSRDGAYYPRPPRKYRVVVALDSENVASLKILAKRYGIATQRLVASMVTPAVNKAVKGQALVEIVELGVRKLAEEGGSLDGLAADSGVR